MGNSVLIAGTPTPYYDIEKLYEKTSVDQEVVTKRVLSKGTSDHQLKLYVASAVPVAIGDWNSAWPVLVSGSPDSQYAKDGEPLSWIPIEDGLVVELTLDDGDTLTKEALVYAEAGTGKAIDAASAPAGAIPIGRAVEAASASGADGTCIVRLQKMEVAKA
jgi:hypothetical protein